MPDVFALLPDHKVTFLDNNGNPASGGQLFVYAAGSSTKSTIYTESDGLTAQANPVVLNSRGEPPNGVYAASGAYKLVFAPSTDSDPPTSPFWTRDNVEPINDQAATIDEWVASGVIPTFQSTTTFTLSGDQTTAFHIGRRVRPTISAGFRYGYISNSVFSSPTTTVTVVLDSGTLDSSLSAVSLGLLRAVNSSIPHTKITASGTTLTAPLTGTDITTSGVLKQTVGTAVSAAALAINVAGNIFNVTGTTTITSLNSKGVGTVVVLTFSGSLTLTHNATTLILPGAANITTQAGDQATFYEYSTGSWRCIAYVKAQKSPGGLVQEVSTLTGVLATGTTTIPLDDTIPQISEGTEFMTQAITPKNVNNTLIINVVFNFALSAVVTGVAALFRDATTNALAAASKANQVAGNTNQIVLTHIMAAGTTSSTTFRVRAGPSAAATMTFNGSAGARLFGGVYASSITIREVTP